MCFIKFKIAGDRQLTVPQSLILLGLANSFSHSQRLSRRSQLSSLKVFSSHDPTLYDRQFANELNVIDEGNE